MPFKKNIERENILINYWRQGNTVKHTSLLTGIPEGTISHYFARFNKKKDKYKIPKNGSQEPPRSSPFDFTIAYFTLERISKKVQTFFETGDYAGACDYLQAIMLLQDVRKRFLPIIKNSDLKTVDEAFQKIVKLWGNASPTGSQNVKSQKVDLTPTRTVSKSGQKQDKLPPITKLEEAIERIRFIPKK